jgi:uncharacterized membrane protein YdjX (TVP38/TMEM64 family)
MAAVTSMRPPTEKPAGNSSKLVIVLRVAMLVLIAAGSVYLLIDHREWFSDPRKLKLEVLSWGAWGPIAYIMLFAVGPSFLVPGAVMTIAGGLAFGALWGAVWSLTGADLGALIAFGAGRFMGRSFVEWAIGTRFERVLGRLTQNGFYVTLYLRIVPVIPYNAFNLLAGASPIKFRDYFWASAIGMIPGTVLFAFLGDALWHPASPRFFVAIAMILVCFASGETYRRWKTSDQTDL